MSWVCEVAMRGEANAGEPVWTWFKTNLARTWSELPDLSALDVYRPAQQAAHDPYNDDKHGPLLLAMPEFRSVEGLTAARPRIEADLAHLPSGITATVSGFERRLYPIAGKAAPMHAPFSYVVRYHRPAEDEKAFVANYVATHPQTQADLPKIRSILCYFPVQMSGRLPDADYMIGNEVVFDTIGDFNAAMQSPVRQELRKHFHEFPKFSGAVTHFPMDRIRLVPAR